MPTWRRFVTRCELADFAAAISFGSTAVSATMVEGNSDERATNATRASLLAAGGTGRDSVDWAAAAKRFGELVS